MEENNHSNEGNDKTDDKVSSTTEQSSGAGAKRHPFVDKILGVLLPGSSASKSSSSSSGESESSTSDSSSQFSFSKSAIADLPSTAVQSIHLDTGSLVEVPDDVFIWKEFKKTQPSKKHSRHVSQRTSAHTSSVPVPVPAPAPPRRSQEIVPIQQQHHQPAPAPPTPPSPSPQLQLPVSQTPATLQPPPPPQPPTGSGNTARPSRRPPSRESLRLPRHTGTGTAAGGATAVSAIGGKHCQPSSDAVAIKKRNTKLTTTNKRQSVPRTGGVHNNSDRKLSLTRAQTGSLQTLTKQERKKRK